MKRRAIDPTNATLLEVAYVQTGSFRKSARVAAFVQAWGVCRDALGRTPTIEEYAEYWGQSERTAYRELRDFRDVFTCSDPDPVCEKLGEARDTARADLAGVLAA